jgi:hypothetical protein
MEKLIAEFIDLLGHMSYYNAAESTYNSEAVERNACRKELKAKANELRQAGLKPEDYVSGYLVSSYEYA